MNENKNDNYKIGSHRGHKVYGIIFKEKNAIACFAMLKKNHGCIPDGKLFCNNGINTDLRPEKVLPITRDASRRRLVMLFQYFILRPQLYLCFFIRRLKDE